MIMADGGSCHYDKRGTGGAMDKAESKDWTLDAFKKVVPHLRGALWWSRNDIIKERSPDFNKNDNHQGHPVLSIRREEVSSRAETVPMLVGTSGNYFDVHQKNCCVDVVGLTKDDPDHHAYFGSIVEPMLVSVAELLAGVKPEKGEYVFIEKDRSEFKHHGEKARLEKAAYFEYRDLMPNWDKPIVNDSEMAMIDDYCIIHNL